MKELRQRGLAAYDADDDGYAQPKADGAWGWRVDAIAALFARSKREPLFFAGCSEEQAEFTWDFQVLLTAPEAEIVDRLRERTTNTYGRRRARGGRS